MLKIRKNHRYKTTYAPTIPATFHFSSSLSKKNNFETLKLAKNFPFSPTWPSTVKKETAYPSDRQLSLSPFVPFFFFPSFSSFFSRTPCRRAPATWKTPPDSSARPWRVAATVVCIYDTAESEKGKVVIVKGERGRRGEKERRKAAERSHRRPAVSPANSVGSSLANPGISTSICVYAPPTYPSTMGSTYVAHTSRAMCVLPANKRRGTLTFS